MAEWKKRSKKTDDVIYFPYITEQAAHNAKEVYLWDVDKTYLDTKFETFRGLLKTATEKAHQKKNIPGSAKLVLNLKLAWQKRHDNKQFPIFFISASPPQMEKKIRQKLEIDGVQPFGIFCKDNLPNLRPRRVWRLNKHVGYKLQALLQLRSFLHEDVRLILFGDDGEFDAVIYSLFSDLCSRRLDTSEMRKILNSFHVLDEQIDTLFRLQDLVPNNDPVEKVYINLVDDTDIDYYLKFGRRTLPTANSLQAALDLCQDSRLEAKHVIEIASALINSYNFTKEEIGKSLDDLVRKEKLGQKTCEQLIKLMKKNNVITPDFEPSVKPRAIDITRGHTVISLEGAFEPWIPDHIDYLNDYR